MNRIESKCVSCGRPMLVPGPPCRYCMWRYWFAVGIRRGMLIGEASDFADSKRDEELAPWNEGCNEQQEPATDGDP